jgi:hypothetical protein
VAALSAWLHARRSWPADGDLLFSLKRTGTPITDMSLGKIVREAFATIGHEAEDMGPRILRNTYCRRLLIRGVAPDTVTERLGLASNRTVERIAATIDVPVSQDCPLFSREAVSGLLRHTRSSNFRIKRTEQHRETQHGHTLAWALYALTLLAALFAGLRWIITNDPSYAWAE